MPLFDSRLFTDAAPATAPDEIQSYRWYSNGRKPMKPERIKAVWERRGDGPYVLGEWVLKEVTVTGLLIKKDGTPGRVNEECQFIRYGEQRQGLPAWLKSAINSSIPS